MSTTWSAGAAVVLSLALAGCGGDGDPAPRAEPGATAASTEATSSPSSSGVDAARGPLITASGVTLNAPTDWTGEVDTSSTGGAVLGPDIGADFLALSVLEDLTTSAEDVDDLATSELQTTSIRPQPTRQPDVAIAGLPAYHLSGEDTGFVRRTETFGFAHDNDVVEIIIGSPMDRPQAERDATNAAILASVTLGD